MQIRLKFTTPKLVIFFAASVLGGCSSQSNQDYASSLVYCSEGNPESFNPQLATSGTSFDASARTVFNRLVELDAATGQISALLADSWNVSNDGLTWQIRLRPNIRFHKNNGFMPLRFLNADDVVFSFKRQMTSSQKNATDTHKFPYFHITGLAENLRSIRRMDDLTVAFDLRERNPKFLQILSMEFASILSEEYFQWLEANGREAEFDVIPVGTGPFVFSQFKQHRHIRFKAFHQYFQGKPLTENLIFAITPDSSLRLSRLRSGECDVMAQPSPAHFALIQSKDDLKLNVQPGLSIAYWAFHTQKPPFDDIRVRQALNFAVNRTAIIESVYGSSAELAESPVPPILSGAAEDTLSYAYDPAYALSLLSQANFPFNHEIEIWAMPVSRPYNPNAKKMAELIQGDLKHIGVRSRIVSFEWREFLRRISAGEHDTVLIGWTGDLPNAENFLNPVLSCDAVSAGSNRAFWCNEEFDQALKQAAITDDPKQYQKNILEAQSIFKQQAPWMPIAHGTQSIATRKNIQGVRLTSTGGVSLEHAHKATQ